MKVGLKKLELIQIKALKHESQFYLRYKHYACFYLVSVHQMMPPLTVVIYIYLQLTTH